MKRSDVISKIKSLNGESGHKWVVDTYNKITPLPRGYKLQNDDWWCAATISAVFHSLGYDDLAECSCPMMIKKATKLGIWEENDAYIPKPADVILYDWEDDGKGDNRGEPNHVGFVIEVNEANKTFIVREGNKKNTVGNREMKINGKTIRGFIKPEYEQEEEDVKMPTIKSGSKGKAVAVWQIIAGAYPDGEFKSETLKATKVFQQEHGLTVDGIVGDKTWSEGLKTL